MCECQKSRIANTQLIVIIEKGLPDTKVQGSVQIYTGEPIKLKLRKTKRRAQKPRKPTKTKTPDLAAISLAKGFKWRMKKATTRLVIKDYDYLPQSTAIRLLNGTDNENHISAGPCLSNKAVLHGSPTVPKRKVRSRRTDSAQK